MEPSFPLDGADILLEHDIQRLGRALYEGARGKSTGLFGGASWPDAMIERAMDDPSLKADLFRLVDALPALSGSREIARHAREYLLAGGHRLPAGLDLALRATHNVFAAWISALIIRQNVNRMARRFIVSPDERQAGQRLRRLWNNGFGFTVDLLGEATVNEAEAAAYAARYGTLIEALPVETARWPEREILDRSPDGAIPRVNISLKLSAMDPLLDAVDPDGCVERLLRRIGPLLRRAKELGAFINFDLEQWSLHEITYRLLERVALDPEFTAWPHLGIVVQGYLKSANDDVDRLLTLAQRRGTPLTVRLVKGAYWDYEVVHAQLHGYPCPVYIRKAHTDAAYERLARRLLENHGLLHAAFGTHNLRTIAAALASAERLGLKPGEFELQMLYGMSDRERNVLRDLGHRVRLYAPVGDLLTGMAYLVRRLLENTANAGFLRLSHHDKAGIEQLLAKPEENRIAAQNGAVPGGRDEFGNCPLSDSSLRRKRARRLRGW